jgi:hypothetical protein
VPVQVIQGGKIWSYLIVGLLMLTLNNTEATYKSQQVRLASLDAIPQVRNCSVPSEHPVQASLFMSPQGSDFWNDGTHYHPLRTLSVAREAVRRLKARGMTGDIVVSLAAGDYFLNDTLFFTEADSGTDGFDVLYKNADAIGSARLIGGMRLSKWSLYSHISSHAIYQTVIPPSLSITTLFEDGVRADEARFPHRQNPAGLPMSHSPYLVSANPGPSSTVLTYSSGDLPTRLDDLAGLKVFIWPGHDWFTDIVPVASYDRNAHQLTLAHETRYPVVAGSRYFVEGALSLLGAPGEFFHDSKKGILYYCPRSGVVDGHEIIAPTLNMVLSVQGSSPENPVHNLRFEGLRFEGSGFTSWYRFGWPGAGQSGEPHIAPSFDRQIEMVANRLGLVTFENTDHVDLMFSHVKNSGFGGVYLRFSNQHDCIYGNLIEHVGINGITLQGRYPGEGDVLHHNVLSNNLIRYVGEMAGNAAGVDISNSSSNEVSFSRIHDSPRFGVLWHADGLPGSLLYAHGNIFEFLRVSEAAQDSGDTGAVYAFGLSADNNPPRTNFVDRVVVANIFADPSMMDLPPDGVFMDNASSYQILSNIRVDRSVGAPYRQNSSPHIFQNVSWESGFDGTAIDEAHIDLRPDFPAVYHPDIP